MCCVTGEKLSSVVEPGQKKKKNGNTEDQIKILKTGFFQDIQGFFFP